MRSTSDRDSVPPNRHVDAPTLASAVAAEAPYPKAVYAWFVVICLQMAYAIAMVDRQIMALLVGPIRRDLGLTDTQFSLLVGFAFVIFYSTMGLFCGRLADTSNRRNMIIMGMILWCMATVACGLAHSFEALFVARMLVGVGEAVLSPAAYSMIADYFPKHRRARAAAAYAMAISMGNSAALLFGGATIAAVAHSDTATLPILGTMRSWQAVFVYVGLPGLLIAGLMAFVREPVRRDFDRSKSGLRDALSFMHQRLGTLSLIVLSFSFNGLITYCIATWLPATFIRNFGWTASEIAYAQGITLLIFGPVGALTGGLWVSRRGAVVSNSLVLTTARNTSLMMPVFALLIGFAPEPWMRLVGLAGLAFFASMTSALGPAAIFNLTPNHFRGSVMSINLLSGTLIGFGFGVTVVALLTDYVFGNDIAIGKSLAIVIVAAAFIAATCLHFASKRPDKDYV